MDKYIKELLFEYDCVIIPGFGGFLTQYISADIHPITNKFTPPTKKIAFNEQLKTNDGLLVGAVALAENISREEALKLIQEYVGTIKEHVGRINLFELKDIGRLFYNTGNCLEFEPDTTLNYLEESYGLTELFFKPIERKFTPMNKPSNVDRPTRPANNPNSDSPQKSNVGLLVFTIIFLIIAGSTGFFYFNKENKDLAGINPFVLFSDNTEKKVVEIPAIVLPAPVVEEETVVAEPEREEIITTKTGRYFIVVGSFKKKENAFKLKEKFEGEDQMVSIIEPYSKKKYYRVSIADFDTKESAINKLGELKATYGNSIWVLSY